MNARLYRLMEKHQRIDRLLELERRRKWRDPFRILRLKKLKLRVRDLIRRIATGQRRARHAMS